MIEFTHCGREATCRRLMELYYALRAHFGHRQWWPADTPFEVCVGAILTQNTAWENVKKAIGNLKTRELMTPFAIHEVNEKELADLIRPSGYYNQKAARLKLFVGVLFEDFEGSLERMLDLPMEEMRDRLIAVKGIGEETADSIILYAAGKPTFVVDAYTKRILQRKGLLEEGASYSATKEFLEGHLPRDVELYNDFHAQFVALGHSFCKRVPLCEKCPVRGL